MRTLMTLSLIAVPILADAQICFDGRFPEPLESGRFLDNGDGTVTDTVSGLMWKQCAEGQTWSSSSAGCEGQAIPLSYIEELYPWVGGVNKGDSGNNLGRTDWRIPTLYELASLTRGLCVDPAIDTSAFPNTPTDVFYASTHCGKYGIYGIDFSDAQEGCTDPNGSEFLRLVRNTSPLRTLSLSVNAGGYLMTSPPAAQLSIYGPQSCSADYDIGCTGSYVPGTQVRITAHPQEGYRLSAWVGDCIDTDMDTCLVNVTDSDIGIYAEFAPTQPIATDRVNLSDARYFYKEPIPDTEGGNHLSYQGWKGGCTNTQLILDVEQGAVDVYFCDQSDSNCKRYQDTILADYAVFAYNLYLGDEQGFGLTSVDPAGSRVTAFYYCFNLDPDDPGEPSP